jgi:hypothetical protein
MNIMFKINGKICTPVLNGSILPGITRKSILELLRHEGADPVERRISVDELVQAAQDGTLEEAWGCGPRPSSPRSACWPTRAGSTSSARQDRPRDAESLPEADRHPVGQSGRPDAHGS